MSQSAKQSADEGSSGILHGIRHLKVASRVPITVLVSLVVFGLQAVHSVILARLLGPEGRGEYGTIVLFSQTMLYVGLVGTHYSIARAATRGVAAVGALQAAAFRVGLMTGIGSTLIAATLCLVGLPDEKRYLLPLALICTLLLPCEHLRLTAQAVDHGRGSFNRYNASRLFAAAVFPLLMLVLFLGQVRDLTWIAWATVLTSVVGYVFYWLISDQKSVLQPPSATERSSAKARNLIREGRSDGALVVANDLFDRLATLLVLWLASFEDQGYYLTALPAATLLLVAPNAFELFAFRKAADESHRLSLRELQKFGAGFIFIQVFVAAGLMLCIAPLIHLVYTEDFSGSIPIAKVLIAAMAANGLTIIGEGYLRGRHLAKLGVYTRVVSAPIMVVGALGISSLSPTLRIAVAVFLGHLVNAALVLALVYLDVKKREPGASQTENDSPQESGVA